MKKRPGFTMIELLVVIGIIGLLAVFLTPKLLGAKDRAKETAVKAVMHSMQLAVEAYAMENETYPLDTNVPLESLATNYLMPGGYLASIPMNPFTGKEYKDADRAGRIIYDYDDATGKFTIMGYNRTGLKKILELSNL
ncbi:hypothetical protein COT42_02860 [Candidatus Saganbacteria bacterium CG08_land_8_20_14_0_20_45_16]|uniref:Uncharacterized protein n=1 Tax=Candidatus Saganbacteria bacterium CG08_land_8_20_14_0_20_45_16 TaxID=2014293 RepID=A0A2H0XZN0_UNCSA|nr:MAG: hypothetical protein COT42_02860 [Candidatus Saganbacteria bacterium CG08_land_8_20_14_0_20_45_16]